MTLILAGEPQGLGQVFLWAVWSFLGQVRAWSSPGFTARRRRGFHSPGEVPSGGCRAAVVAGSTPKGSEEHGGVA